MANAHAISLDRMVRAVEKVRERLLRAVSCLESSGVPYAVAGGNAVAAWVSSVDEAAVRNTRDVDILIRRVDLNTARAALEAGGFTYRHVAGMDVFLDSPGSNARDAVHIIFANEQVREHEPAPNPDIEAALAPDGFRVMSLESLVRVKLTAFRDKDRTHIRDLLDVGLIDDRWIGQLDGELRARLQSILDTPEG